MLPSRIGTVSTVATACTPGTRRALSNTACHATRIFPGSARVADESAIRVTSTFWDFTPESSDESRSIVRPSTPAETNSTTASATSEMTKAFCKRRELPTTVRAPARSACSSSRTGARRAGASPKRSPLSREMATANSITRQSSWTSSARGKLPGQSITNGRIPNAASKTPSTPPESPNTALSVRH